MAERHHIRTRPSRRDRRDYLSPRYTTTWRVHLQEWI